MQNSPDTAELVLAVREFLETRIAPSLDGHTGFHARVAMNALAIVERDLALGPSARAREHDRLKALLGRDGSLEDLNAALARAIRTGTITLDAPALKEHLRETTLDKVAIDQPRYSGYRDALSALGRDPDSQG